MKQKIDIEIGRTYQVDYPFTLKAVEYMMHTDPSDRTESWVPGIFEDQYGDPMEFKKGFMLITVVDVCKPGKYPARVFFTRKWTDPDGNQFGKNKLHIMVDYVFRKRLQGYKADYYDINELGWF